jgi:hypothetical protein
MNWRSARDHKNARMRPVFSRQDAKTPGIRMAWCFAFFAALRETIPLLTGCGSANFQGSGRAAPGDMVQR